MIAHGKDIKVFTGNSNPQLAKDICKELGIPLGSSEVGAFSDGENFASIYETVRGSDVFVVQSTCSFVDEGKPGTVTCNYDGFQKHRTIIGSNVFVGCNTNFVPPVQIGDGAFIAAATTVTQDVPQDAMVIGRTRQQVKEGWAAANREKKRKK